MNAIKTIYLPVVETTFNAQYIARAFDLSGIAKVSKIAIEPNFRHFNRVYVDIDYWHDNEAAYNFITRLNNPHVETKFVHNDDNWWVVRPNKFPHKTVTSGYKGRIITIFKLDQDDYPTELLENFAWVDLKLEEMAQREKLLFEQHLF
jgi:hypothetical protein